MPLSPTAVRTPPSMGSSPFVLPIMTPSTQSSSTSAPPLEMERKKHVKIATTAPLLLTNMHILLLVFSHLPTTPTLFTALLVCRTWNVAITQTWRHLRARIFLLPPLPPYSLSSPKSKALELHPVFRRLDYYAYSMHSCNTAPSLSTRVMLHTLNGTLLSESAVAKSFATNPAVQELAVRIGGQEAKVKSQSGVKVWDVMEGLDQVLKMARQEKRPLVWDHRTFPFAGLKYIEPNSSEDIPVIMPEFFDMQAVLAGLRKGVSTEEGLESVGATNRGAVFCF